MFFMLYVSAYYYVRYVHFYNYVTYVPIFSGARAPNFNNFKRYLTLLTWTQDNNMNDLTYANHHSLKSNDCNMGQ